jgi:lipoate-protein ligase B
MYALYYAEMNRVWQVYRLGQVDYETAWRLQDTYANEIARGERPPCLLLLEHPHTYTFGGGGKAENLLWDAAELERGGVAVHWVDRGGDITYHGPGQLVGYPLLKLGPPVASPAGGNGSVAVPQADYTGYLRKLEQVLIQALADLGVQAERIKGRTGVWAPPQANQAPAKLASIGVKVDARGVTRHGFALNVDTDKTYWRGIIACGLRDAAVANLSDLVTPTPGMDLILEAVISNFEQVFATHCVVATERTS